MKSIKRLYNYFTATEKILWLCSMLLIVVPFCIFDRQGWLNLFASVLGITALVLLAKGNPVGQAMMLVFCTIYGYISWGFRYYGELITYTCMCLPLAVAALISWLRHPYKGDKNQVEVNRLPAREIPLMLALTVLVTVVFYFVLRAFGTANLVPSTFSVATSFAAAWLTYRRSPWYAFAYAINDLVLVLLWILACREDIGYLSVVTCFLAFFANDIYGFISWRAMEKRQSGT